MIRAQVDPRVFFSAWRRVPFFWPARRLMRVFLLFFASVCIGAALAPRPATAQAPSSAAAAPGSALIIGNGAYLSGGPPAALSLKSAQNLAGDLSRMGFSVTVETNLRQAPMRRAIERFAAAIRPGSIALFFFTGYGVEAKGSSYLIPVDAEIWTEAQVRSFGISVDSILAAMDSAGARVKIVILDASRRNPFERRFRSLSAGLGAIDLPPQTLLLSSAEPGKVVSDSEGGGSLFVGELLKELRSPDRGAEDIFNRTRLGVSRATDNQQDPLVKSTLAGPVFLKAAAIEATAPQTRDQAEAARPGDAGAARFGPPPGAKPGTAFRDCADCPDLVVLPAGEFAMGSDDFETEQPVHPVAIAKSFAIGRTEITFAQWDACVADGGCAGWRPDDRGAGRGETPVGEVSWSDAHRFLDWLSRKSGHVYRLPSEAEWEYAARAGTNTAFWWGDEVGAGHANCRGCGGPGRPTAAGSYPANGFGLVDTAGNIAEWVEDCWTESYAQAPRDGAVVQGAPCKQRVVRGGSFDAGARYVRPASRFLYDAELRYYTNGFRAVRDLP
jgi:formylglycine-generating enzyme required for sulfatase activity